MLDRLGPWMKSAVTLFVLTTFTALIGALLWTALKQIDFPPGVKEILCILIGVQASSYKDTVGYWLGSSHSSERKTEIMASEVESESKEDK